MKNIEQILIEATETGEIINIKYHGGGQPGSIRQISPISVKNDNVRARCIATNSVQTFKLSRIEVDSNSNSSSSYDPEKKALEPKSLKEALGPHQELLSGLGWLLLIENKSAGLYRAFKNGQLRPPPDVRIEYYESKHGYWDINEQGELVEQSRLSEWPWNVRSNIRDRASSFKKLGAATEKFILFAKEAAEKLALS